MSKFREWCGVSAGVAEHALGVTFADFPAARMVARLAALDDDVVRARRVRDDAARGLEVVLSPATTSVGDDQVIFGCSPAGLRFGGACVPHTQGSRLRDFLARMYGEPQRVRLTQRDVIELAARVGDLLARWLSGRAGATRDSTVALAREIVADVLDSADALPERDDPTPPVRLGPGGEFTRDLTPHTHRPAS